MKVLAQKGSKNMMRKMQGTKQQITIMAATYAATDNLSRATTAEENVWH